MGIDAGLISGYSDLVRGNRARNDQIAAQRTKDITDSVTGLGRIYGEMQAKDAVLKHLTEKLGVDTATAQNAMARGPEAVQALVQETQGKARVKQALQALGYDTDTTGPADSAGWFQPHTIPPSVRAALTPPAADTSPPVFGSDLGTATPSEPGISLPSQPRAPTSSVAGMPTPSGSPLPPPPIAGDPRSAFLRRAAGMGMDPESFKMASGLLPKTPDPLDPAEAELKAAQAANFRRQANAPQEWVPKTWEERQALEAAQHPAAAAHVSPEDAPLPPALARAAEKARGMPEGSIKTYRDAGVNPPITTPKATVWGTKETGWNTPLTPEEETAFKTWKNQYAPNDSGLDYDLRGAFKAGLKPDPITGHWPDTFKKPNHPTFSWGSVYAPSVPEAAGRWDGETYIPPQSPATELARVLGVEAKQREAADYIPADQKREIADAEAEVRRLKAKDTAREANMYQSPDGKMGPEALARDIAAAEERLRAAKAPRQGRGLEGNGSNPLPPPPKGGPDLPPPPSTTKDPTKMSDAELKAAEEEWNRTHGKK